MTYHTNTSSHVTRHAHGYGGDTEKGGGPGTDRWRHQATKVGVVLRGENAKGVTWYYGTSRTR